MAWGQAGPRVDQPSDLQGYRRLRRRRLEAARLGIAAAKRAFETSVWAVDHELRARVIGQIADAFERHRDSLLDLLATENGKVRGEAGFELDMVPSKLRYYAAVALTESGRVLTPKPGSISMILRQAAGVVGVIAPWNSPVVLTIRSLAPALAAGCTAVIKLPGQVAQVAHLMAKIMAEAPDLQKASSTSSSRAAPMVPPTLSNRRTFP
jgi:betaine-aldehyde dehydrogenase